MIEEYTVLCDSNIPWHHNRYSKHHIMSRLARKNRVLFINPQVDVLEFLKSRQYNPMSLIRRTERPEGESLDVFTPLAVPFRDKFDFVHRIDPVYLVRQIKRILGVVERENLVLFLGNPWNVFLLDHFGDCACSVYHCSDNFPALFEGAFRDKFEMKEVEMITRADAVIAVSKTLWAKAAKHNPNSFVVDHGVDEIYFETEEPAPIPDELGAITGPRIGYVGSISSYLDTSLLEYAMARHRDKNFIYIGPYDRRGDQERFNALQTYSNCHYLGKKDWKRLPAYIQHLDVCLVPFLLNEWVSGVNSLKIKEYLAAGRPVVSTFPVGEDLRSAVKVARSKEEFSDLIEVALSEGRQPSSKETISRLVKDGGWNSKVEEISNLILECIKSKRVRGGNPT